MFKLIVHIHVGLDFKTKTLSEKKLCCSHTYANMFANGLTKENKLI